MRWSVYAALARDCDLPRSTSQNPMQGAPHGGRSAVVAHSSSPSVQSGSPARADAHFRGGRALPRGRGHAHVDCERVRRERSLGLSGLSQRTQLRNADIVERSAQRESLGRDGSGLHGRLGSGCAIHGARRGDACTRPRRLSPSETLRQQLFRLTEGGTSMVRPANQHHDDDHDGGEEQTSQPIPITHHQPPSMCPPSPSHICAKTIDIASAPSARPAVDDARAGEVS